MSLIHFPTLASVEVSPPSAVRYTGVLSDWQAEFTCRFSDFAKIEDSLELVSRPVSYDYEKAPPSMQLELIDLQCHTSLREKFKTFTLLEFYASLSETQFAYKQ